MKTVFIDGSAGTTGLRIRERLSERTDVSVLVLSEETRKDVEARRDALNSADVAFLCLPDAAAIEAVSLVENSSTVVIDTSTAHRTDDAWQYGFPEIAGRRERIATSRRIANPGCHASGFIALVEPLVRSGIVANDAELAAFSLTGYSGGGKKMIAEYESALSGGSPDVAYLGGRQYALAQSHKHLPEMSKICGLSHPPVFSPIIAPHFSGMETTVMLHRSQVNGGISAITDCYRDSYGANGVVKFAPPDSFPSVVSSAMMAGRDDMLVSVHGNEERIIVTAVFDNLGKGASGAAIQNMNIALGLDEREGLVVA